MLTSSPFPVLLEEISEEEQRQILERFAGWVLRRGLAVPAILFLEMSKPLNFIGSQLLLALDPLVRGVFFGTDYRKFALILERDENVEQLIRLIESGTEKRKD